MRTSECIYSLLGGETALRVIVDQLYGFMARAAEVEHVRKIHPQDMSLARDRLINFLSSMFVGSPLYMQAFALAMQSRRCSG